MQTICSTLLCLQATYGSGYTAIQTKDQLLQVTKSKQFVCFETISGYNCKHTNNFYNPLTD